MSSHEHSTTYAQRVVSTLLLGLVGVLALAAYAAARPQAVGVPAGLSRTAVAISVVLNSLIVLVPACLIGAYAAPRVGLQVHLFDRIGLEYPIWPRLREEFRLATAIGVVGAIVIVLVDVALSPLIPRELPQTAAATAQGSITEILLYVPVRFLYGGVTEELLLRFGLLSAVAFVGWYLTGRERDTPSATVMWIAIVVSALLFGAGHLPALAAQAGLTPILVVRTILLNAVLGVAFGWLYWRHSLESAMVAHVAFHVVVVALSLLQVILL